MAILISSEQLSLKPRQSSRVLRPSQISSMPGKTSKRPNQNTAAAEASRLNLSVNLNNLKGANLLRVAQSQAQIRRARTRP